MHKVQRPSSTGRKVCALTAIAGTCLALSPVAQAGGTISFGEDKSISVGLGMRSSYSSVSKGAPNGSDRSADFNVDSVSLMVGASLNKYIKAYFSTDKTSDGTLKMKDAYAEFHLAPEFNVFAGRVLPPSDRSNLNGPYYLNTWNYPGVVSQYPGKDFGRDDGVVAWGKLLDKKLVYSLGVFQGRNHSSGVSANTSNQSANLLYAGRVAYNFWDAEPAPAYYTGSTYYGAADILTLGLVGMYQKDGVGSKLVKDDYMAWNADLLLEKKLSAGVVTLEGAFYKYDFTQGAAAVDVSGANSVVPGKAALAGAAFLFPQKVGIGQFQPFARYQRFNADGANPDTKTTEAGVNYVIEGANARVSATYSKTTRTASADSNAFVVGLQLQF